MSKEPCGHVLGLECRREVCGIEGVAGKVVIMLERSLEEWCVVGDNDVLFFVCAAGVDGAFNSRQMLGVEAIALLWGPWSSGCTADNRPGGVHVSPLFRCEVGNGHIGPQGGADEIEVVTDRYTGAIAEVVDVAERSA